MRAGAAKVDISPTKEMFPIRAFVDVHDPLYVRAMVLYNGSTKVVLMAVDTGGVSNAVEMIKAISAELKILANHISLSATHDHSTPNSPGGGCGGTWMPRRTTLS